MADAAAEKKKGEAKTKQPSALKRDLQNEKSRLRSRSFRASVLTSIRALENSLSKKEAAGTLNAQLGQIYSLMDKGVKKGIYKRQKADRTKSRLAARLTKI